MQRSVTKDPSFNVMILGYATLHQGYGRAIDLLNNRAKVSIASILAECCAIFTTIEGRKRVHQQQEIYREPSLVEKIAQHSAKIEAIRGRTPS